MSLFRVRVIPEAFSEFSEAFRWYQARSQMAANGFRQEVLETIDALADRAAMWPRNEDGISFAVVGRFPYTVFYSLEGDEAVVLAVAHQRRRPGYWRDRDR